MKPNLRFVICIAALFALPLMAADGETKSATVEQRFLEIDLSLAFRHYEQLKEEMFQLELKSTLLQLDEELPKDVKDKRSESLREQLRELHFMAENLREQALNLEEKIALAKAKK